MYRAILHKDEAVLTARQSNALRDAGILGTTGSRPTLNLEKDGTSGGSSGSGSGSSSGTTFAPQVVIHVNSNGDASIAQQVKEETKKALRELWNELNLAT
ncbi:hypothetical protein [Bacillus sp. SBS7]|uniref:hypothetical protein n=1 Tax=Bacillus sp. SBS7 TaxID=3401756 RepID=UPI003AA9E0C1